MTQFVRPTKPLVEFLKGSPGTNSSGPETSMLQVRAIEPTTYGYFYR